MEGGSAVDSRKVAAVAAAAGESTAGGAVIGHGRYRALVRVVGIVLLGILRTWWVVMVMVRRVMGPMLGLLLLFLPRLLFRLLLRLLLLRLRLVRGGRRVRIVLARIAGSGMSMVGAGRIHCYCCCCCYITLLRVWWCACVSNVVGWPP